MSTKVANSTFKAYLGNQELLLERQAKQKQQNKEKSRHVAIESSHSRYFTDGVRAPLLSDITSRQSCRLDVVRAPRQVSENTSPSPVDLDRKPLIPHIPLEKENTVVSSTDKVSSSLKSMKYLLPNGLLKDNEEIPVTSRSTSDLDIRWQRHKNKNCDARDVLYRNTYAGFPEKIRYHAKTLPSITSQNKSLPVPRVKKPKTNFKKILVKEQEQEPVQPKTKTVSTTEHNLVKSNSTNTFYEIGFLKVQKIKQQSDDVSNGNSDLFLAVRQPTDIDIPISGRRSNLRIERPLKYESVGPNLSSRLYRKHSFLRNMKSFTSRDHRSADVYKEYLDNLKLKMETHNDSDNRVGKDLLISKFGRENRVLQSVIDVNMPNIDAPGTTVSHDSKSLVIEIRPTWKEIPNGILDDIDSDDQYHPNPVNTPDPAHSER